jgi:hypothetical protein
MQEVRTFATTTSALVEMAGWLHRWGVTRVVMGSTSSYWKGVYYLLEADGFECWWVNARDVKNVPGRPKTDKANTHEPRCATTAPARTSTGTRITSSPRSWPPEPEHQALSRADECTFLTLFGVDYYAARPSAIIGCGRAWTLNFHDAWRARRTKPALGEQLESLVFDHGILCTSRVDSRLGRSPERRAFRKRGGGRCAPRRTRDRDAFPVPSDVGAPQGAQRRDRRVVCSRRPRLDETIDLQPTAADISHAAPSDDTFSPNVGPYNQPSTVAARPTNRVPTAAPPTTAPAPPPTTHAPGLQPTRAGARSTKVYVQPQPVTPSYSLSTWVASGSLAIKVWTKGTCAYNDYYKHQMCSQTFSAKSLTGLDVPFPSAAQQSITNTGTWGSPQSFGTSQRTEA